MKNKKNTAKNSTAAGQTKKKQRSRRCASCEILMKKLPHDAECWGFSDKRFSWTTHDEKDYKDAIPRLSKKRKPKNLKSCTGKQKRIISYLKVFRFFQGKGQRNVRMTYSPCILAYIRQTFPNTEGDTDDETSKDEYYAEFTPMAEEL